MSLLRAEIGTSFDELVMAGLGFVESMRAEYGEVKSIAAHSLGGLIAIRMALLDSKSHY